MDTQSKETEESHSRREENREREREREREKMMIKKKKKKKNKKWALIQVYSKRFNNDCLFNVSRLTVSQCIFKDFFQVLKKYKKNKINLQ